MGVASALLVHGGADHGGRRMLGPVRGYDDLDWDAGRGAQHGDRAGHVEAPGAAAALALARPRAPGAADDLCRPVRVRAVRGSRDERPSGAAPLRPVGARSCRRRSSGGRYDVEHDQVWRIPSAPARPAGSAVPFSGRQRACAPARAEHSPVVADRSLHAVRRRADCKPVRRAAVPRHRDRNGCDPRGAGAERAAPRPAVHLDAGGPVRSRMVRRGGPVCPGDARVRRVHQGVGGRARGSSRLCRRRAVRFFEPRNIVACRVLGQDGGPRAHAHYGRLLPLEPDVRLGAHPAAVRVDGPGRGHERIKGRPRRAGRYDDRIRDEQAGAGSRQGHLQVGCGRDGHGAPAAGRPFDQVDGAGDARRARRRGQRNGQAAPAVRGLHDRHRPRRELAADGRADRVGAEL